MGVVTETAVVVGDPYDVLLELRRSDNMGEALRSGLDWYEVLVDTKDETSVKLVTKWENIEAYERFRQKVRQLLPESLRGTKSTIREVSAPQVLRYVTPDIK